MEKTDDMVLILDDRQKFSGSKRLENLIVFMEFPYLCCLFPIVLILIMIILCSGEFNDGIYNNLLDNWKMNPIITINLIDNNNEKDKKTQKNLGIFKGIKNPKKYKNTILTNWRTKNFEFDFLDDFSYKDLLYNSIKNNEINNYKICGKDSENNSLYFPNNIECPINFIEISNNSKSSIDGKYNYKKLNLSDDLFLYYSNENIDGEILVQLKVSSKEGMCFNLKYDNDFAPYISNYNIKNKKKGCINDLYDERLKIIDEDSIDNFLKNNNIKEKIKINRNYDSKIYLYKRGYIGFNESYKINEIKKILFAPRLSKIKNILGIIIIILHIPIHYFFICFKIKKNKTYFLELLFTIIFLIPLILLFYFEINNYKKFKKIIISISTLFDYKTYINLDICILHFLIIIIILKILAIKKIYKLFDRHFGSCNFNIKRKFYVPREIIIKLYKHRIKLLEDKKHENKFIEKENLKILKRFLKNLYLNKDIKIKLNELSNFNHNNDRNILKCLNKINSYKNN